MTKNLAWQIASFNWRIRVDTDDLLQRAEALKQGLPYPQQIRREKEEPTDVNRV